MFEDIELLESESILKGLRFPHKIKKVTQIVITSGQFSCLVDFHTWTLKAPAVALFLPGQVVESIELDEDFAGFGMMMNPEFTDSLNLPVSLKEEIVKHLFCAYYYGLGYYMHGLQRYGRNTRQILHINS